MKTIAVYGSLKKGKYNHPLIEGCEHVDNIRVKGTMYRVSSYPALVDEGENYYDAEVYEIPDSIYQQVRGMELGAGYKEDAREGAIVYYADERLAEYCKENLEVIEEY